MQHSQSSSGVYNLSDIRSVFQLRDRRRGSRTETLERAFIQVVACEIPEMVGTTVSCATVNVSANGLRFAVDSDIPTGSKIDIWVDISSGRGKYFLSSDVRWCKERADGRYELGVELFGGTVTDFKEWSDTNRFRVS